MGRSTRTTTGLAGALFTSTQLKVLALLFGQPDRAFIQQELIEEAGGGSGAVRRELARLVESGLVVANTVARQKQFRANRDSPIFEELCSIIRKTVALADPLRAALRPLEKKITLAAVYGSVARGTDHAASDIDLLVVAEELPLETLFARLGPVERKISRAIHPTIYTPAEFDRRLQSGNPFLKKLLAGDTIVLLGKLPDEKPR